MLISAFALSSEVGFGTSEYDFINFTNSLEKYFGSLVVMENMTDNLDKKSSICTLFLMLFSILFKFVLIKMLAAIVMGTYLFLRNRDRLLIAAKAEMITNKTKAFLKIFLNLVFFRTNNELSSDVAEYMAIRHKLHSDEHISDKIALVDKLKYLENSIAQQSKASYFLIFKMNLALLSSFLTQSALKNKEISIKEFKSCIKSILEKERLDELKRKAQSLDVEYNCNLIGEMLAFFSVLLIFSYLMITELNVTNSYSLQDLSKKSVFTPKFTADSLTLSLDQIQSVSEIYGFLSNVMLGFTKNEMGYYNNYVYRNEVRITVQMNNFVSNSAEFSQNVIPKIIIPGYNYSCFRGSYTKTLYCPETTSRPSFKQLGGIVFDYYNYAQGSQSLSLITSDSLFSAPCSYVAVE